MFTFIQALTWKTKGAIAFITRRAFDSLVQRVDPRLICDSWRLTLQLATRMLPQSRVVTLLRHAKKKSQNNNNNNNNNTDCRSHWRPQWAKMRQKTCDANDGGKTTWQTTARTCLPTVCKQAAFITARNQPRPGRPSAHTTRRPVAMLLTWKKKCSPPAYGRDLYARQWRPTVLSRPHPDSSRISGRIVYDRLKEISQFCENSLEKIDFV